MSPALLTRMSTSPHCAANARNAAPSRRSTAWMSAFPSRERLASSRRSRFRAARWTRQPSAAKLRAQARPMPFDPPVTSTDLPLSPRSIVQNREGVVMPAYIIAQINITDPQKYQEYAKLAGPATAKYGGKFLVRGGDKTELEGRIPYQRIVV